MSESGPSRAWEAYASHNYGALSITDRKRLDAAEAMIHRRFGINPTYYVRASEYPRSVKLADIIAALVLDRCEWETGGGDRSGD